jgi:hypothetical protein
MSHYFPPWLLVAAHRHHRRRWHAFVRLLRSLIYNIFGLPGMHAAQIRPSPSQSTTNIMWTAVVVSLRRWTRSRAMAHIHRVADSRRAEIGAGKIGSSKQ